MAFSFLVIFLGFSMSTIIAQDVISEGYIKMEITDVESDDEQMGAMLQMMKGTTTEMYFNEDKSLIKMDMMGGMVKNTFLLDNKSQDMTMLIDAMGQKMNIGSSKMDREKEGSDQVDYMKGLKVKIDENDTKEILGYTCKRAEISNPDTDEAGMSFSMYITDQIKANSKMIQGLNYTDLPGFPLEYVMITDKMSLTVSTKEIKKEIDSKVFEINTGGFKKMTYKEFMDSIGKMGGGMGF